MGESNRVIYSSSSKDPTGSTSRTPAARNQAPVSIWCELVNVRAHLALVRRHVRHESVAEHLEGQSRPSRSGASTDHRSARSSMSPLPKLMGSIALGFAPGDFRLHPGDFRLVAPFGYRDWKHVARRTLEGVNESFLAPPLVILDSASAIRA